MSSRRSRRLLAGVAALGVLAASAAQAGAAHATTPDTTSPSATRRRPPPAAAAPTVEVPAQFADGSVHIALVAQLSAGDYFEQWRAGAEAQADALGVTLDFLGADGDNDRHALNLQQAIDNDADAIIVDHGFPETIQPVIAQAVDAGIPLVAFDVDPGDNPVVTLSQSDEEIAGQVLDVLEQDTGGEADVIYVYVSGFAPLDRRDAVWQQFKQDNPGHQRGRPDRRGGRQHRRPGRRAGEGRVAGQPRRHRDLRPVRRVRQGRGASDPGARPRGSGHASTAPTSRTPTSPS